MDARGATALEALQAAFQAHVLGEPSDFPAAVTAGGPLDPAQRLAIYRNAYVARLIDALRDTYGHTHAYLGDEDFDAMAQGYIAEQPSTHPNLRWFGRGFAGFLARHCPADPDIAELATLDWTLRLAFDGADAPVRVPADLAAIAPEAWPHLGLRWHPTCHRLRLAHNTLAIWTALDRDEVPPPTQALSAPVELLVWRLGLQPHFRSLDALEAAAFDWLSAGEAFGSVCVALASTFPREDIAARAGQLLRRWVDDGLISEVVPLVP